MLAHRLLKEESILIIQPRGALERTDFSGLAARIDPYIKQTGGLDGVMVEAQSFPGWSDFAALVSHLRFVRDHHRAIDKVAVVADSKMLTLIPTVAGHFVNAEVRHYRSTEREAALSWLRRPRTT